MVQVICQMLTVFGDPVKPSEEQKCAGKAHHLCQLGILHMSQTGRQSQMLSQGHCNNHFYQRKPPGRVQASGCTSCASSGWPNTLISRRQLTDEDTQIHHERSHDKKVMASAKWFLWKIGIKEGSDVQPSDGKMGHAVNDRSLEVLPSSFKDRFTASLVFAA